MVPGDAVTLRRAIVEDTPAVAAIWRDGWRDGHLGHVPDELVAARTPGSFVDRAAGYITAPATDTVVATVGGKVAGFVVVGGDEVEQVYVAAAHRGSGVAATLLAEAECRVAAGGHGWAWLAVVGGNARARRFYERCGWIDAGRYDHVAPGPDGPIHVPTHRYVKQVGPGRG